MSKRSITLYNYSTKNPKTWDSVKEAAKDIGVTTKTVQKLLNGEQQTIKYTWVTKETIDSGVKIKVKTGNGHWQNKTNCRNAAKKCKSKSEMYKRFASAYIFSIKNGWIDEFFPKSTTKRGKTFWTKENCREEAKKYKTRSEFSFKCNRAYRISLDNGWLDEFGFSLNKKYTKEKCARIAAECEGRSDFKEKYPDEFKAASRGGWLSEFFGKKNISDTKTFNNIKGKYTSPTNLKEKSPYMYKYAEQRGWLGILFPQSKSKACQTVWDYDTCKEEAKKYSTRKEFKESNQIAYYTSYYYDWLNEFFPKPVKSGKTKKIWTKEECAEIAKQCSGRLEFYKKKASAYRFAQAQGWLDEFFGITNKFGKKSCLEIASHYKYSHQLKKMAPTVYKKCLYNGWLDEFYPDEVKDKSQNAKTIRSMILDYVAANGSQTKKDLYRVMLTVAGQNINRKAWGVSYLDNVSFGNSVFIPARSDKRYLKPVRGFNPKEIRYDLAIAK